MRLVCNLNNLTELDDLAPYADYFLVKKELCNLENIYLINQCGKKAILDYSIMVTPFEIANLTKELLSFKDSDCLFYITDLGLAKILKDAGMIKRVIYDPITMLTNSLDINEYASYGFLSLALSNEITLDDMKNIINNTSCQLFLQVFGYRLMFHSRRMLISLYLEKLGRKLNQSDMFLKEASRDDYLPIVENSNGTYIYRGYVLNLLKYLKELDLEFAFLNNFRIKPKDYLRTVEIYYNYLNDKLDINEALEQLDKLNFAFKDGFLFVDSVYNKEEF